MKRSRENGILGPYLVNLPSGDNKREVGGMSKHSAPVMSISTAAAAAGTGGAGETPPVTAEYTRAYLNLVTEVFKGNEDKHEEFVKLMRDFKARRIYDSGLAKKVMELFNGSWELIQGFNAFLSKEDKIILSPEEDQHQKFGRKQPVNNVNKEFRTSEEKIKGMLQVRPSKQGEKTSTSGERNRGVCERRGDCNTERIPSKLEKDQSKTIEKEKQKEDDSEVTKRDKASKEAERGKEKDLQSSQNSFHKSMSIQLAGKLKSPAGDGGEASDGHDKEKSKKPIPDLNPSYSLRPKCSPKPLLTHRTELNLGVLNDSWECIRPGIEDYEERPKNQHEENLFLCEDDRFVLDMLVERAAATTKRVADLLEFIQDPTFEEQMSTFVLEEHLSATNLTCIENIYGNHGLKIIDSLRENAARALPVVLLRLKQKHNEWSRYRVEMNRVMKEVYSRNHDKSLDHSFDFKQQDKK